MATRKILSHIALGVRFCQFLTNVHFKIECALLFSNFFAVFMVNGSVSEWYVKEFEVSAIYHLKETSEN
jgi:hypothetical protein